MHSRHFKFALALIILLVSSMTSFHYAQAQTNYPTGGTCSYGQRINYGYKYAGSQVQIGVWDEPGSQNGAGLNDFNQNLNNCQSTCADSGYPYCNFKSVLATDGLGDEHPSRFFCYGLSNPGQEVETPITYQRNNRGDITSETSWATITPNSPACQVPITGSCSVSPTSGTAPVTATWTANVSGGNGSYSYSWSGSDGLSGSGSSVTHTYSSAGTNSGSVFVTSGSQSATIPCNNSITVSAPAPTPLPDLTATIGPAVSATVGVSSPFGGTTSNIGNAASGSFNDMFVIYRSDQATVEAYKPINSNPSLAASASASRSTAYTFASAGTYYYRLCTDWNGTVTESNEGNNCSALQSVTVTSAPIPNPPISATCSVAPTSIIVGGQATWSANASGGNGTYSYNWTGTDGLSGTGQSITHTYSSPGTHTASVTVTSGGDSLNVACNNSLTVGNAPQADLTAGSVSAGSPVAGQNATLSATDTNIGNGSSGVFPSLFQIADNAYTVIDVRQSGNISLTPNESAAVNVSYTFASAGTYQTRACANMNASYVNVTTESNYSNNCGPWTPVTVTAQQVDPDLTAGAVSLTLAPAGQSSSFGATASNIGQGDAGPFPLLFQIENTALFNSGYFSGLAAGANADGSATRTLSAGTYRVRACANYNTSWVAIVAETDYNNNCGGWTDFTITGPVPPTPTCSLTANPSTVPSTLTWSSTNATSCTGGGFNTGGATSGSTGVSVAGTYTLSCNNGAASCPVSTVTVGGGNVCTNPTGTISANPTRVKAGSSSTITYSATGIATSCTVTGPGVNVTLPANTCNVPTGTVSTGALTTQSVYILTCDGVERARTIVNVIPTIIEF